MKILAPLVLAGGVLSFAKAGMAEGYSFQYFCRGGASTSSAVGPMALTDSVESSKRLVEWLKTYVGYDQCDQAQIELEKLTEIDLTGFEADDLSPLSSLKNLKRITLGGAKVSSLAPLASLSQLESITITDSQVGSLTYFNPFSHLKSVALRSSILTNLNGLKSESLTHILIDSPVLSDLSGVAGASKTESLQLVSGQFSDIGGLASIQNTLKTLWVASDSLSNFSIIEKLKSLEEVWISSSKMQSLEILSKLPDLQSITLANTGITSLEGLSQFESKSEIKSFQIAYAPLASAEGLEYLPALESLALRGTRIKDISFVANLPKLKQLDLSENEFTDISPLESQSNLSSLHLSSARIQNLDALDNLVKLQDLDISYNNISNLTSLRNVRLLDTFSAVGNAISNADGIAGAVGMKYLNLSQNPLQGSLPFLEMMESLNYLGLAKTGISNGTRFPALTKLTTLDVSDNPVSTVDNMVVLENLETIDTTRTNITSFRPFTIPGVSGERNTLRWLTNIISDVSPKITMMGILQGAQIVEIRSEAKRVTDVIELRNKVYTEVSTKDQIAGSREARCLAVYSHFSYQKFLIESLKSVATEQGVEISDYSSIFKDPCDNVKPEAVKDCKNDRFRTVYGQRYEDCNNVMTLLDKDTFYLTSEGQLLKESFPDTHENLQYESYVDPNIQMAAYSLFNEKGSLSINIDNARQAYEAAISIAKSIDPNSENNPLNKIKGTFKSQLESSIKEGEDLLIKLRKMRQKMSNLIRNETDALRSKISNINEPGQGQ